MDRISQEQRSYTMSRVRSKNTTPEMIIRSFLHRKGFRFRLHVKKLPGTPDLVLSKYKTVIDVRGCFWHRHDACGRASIPYTNTEFWLNKFNRNVERDIKNENALRALGWRVIVVWECELKQRNRLDELIKQITS